MEETLILTVSLPFNQSSFHFTLPLLNWKMITGILSSYTIHSGDTFTLSFSYDATAIPSEPSHNTALPASDIESHMESDIEDLINGWQLAGDE